MSESSEAADQVVRMMLSGGEVAIRLSGSALKNSAALLLALSKNHKQVYGRTSLVKMLKETRDIRYFTMTPEQYKAFRVEARKKRLLYSAIQDKLRPGAPVDVVLPATEIERANMVFEMIRYVPPHAKERDTPPQEGTRSKKEHRSEPGSRDTRDNSSTRNEKSRQTRTNERPSIEEKLKGNRTALDQKQVPARQKIRSRGRAR